MKQGLLKNCVGSLNVTDKVNIDHRKLLRSVVKQSSTMTNNIMTDNTMTTMTDNIMTDNTMTTMTDNTMTDNTMKEMPIYERAICNMKSRTTDILRGANRYGVLEESDEECTNNKVQNVRFDNMRE